MLFVKKVQHAEAERDRAEKERSDLLSGWRAQTETWFATAVRRAAQPGAIRRNSAQFGAQFSDAGPAPSQGDEMREKLLADWGAAEAARGELAAAHEGIGETAKAHAAALAEAAAREVALEIEKAKLEDDGEATRAELLGAREELGRQAAAFKQTQHECGTLRARDEVNRAQLQELGASAAQGRELGESANMSLLKVKEEQLRERQAAKQLAEEHSRLEKELHLSKAVCERVRAEAAAEHAGLLEAQAKLEIAEESLVALQRENKVLVMQAENTAAPSPSRRPTAPSTVERLGAPSYVA